MLINLSEQTLRPFLMTRAYNSAFITGHLGAYFVIYPFVAHYSHPNQIKYLMLHAHRHGGH